jgi:hypothetical protein
MFAIKMEEVGGVSFWLVRASLYFGQNEGC